MRTTTKSFFMALNTSSAWWLYTLLWGESCQRGFTGKEAYEQGLFPDWPRFRRSHDNWLDGMTEEGGDGSGDRSYFAPGDGGESADRCRHLARRRRALSTKGRFWDAIAMPNAASAVEAASAYRPDSA